MTGELSILVRDNRFGKAMEFEDVVEEYASGVRGGGCGASRDKMYHLGKSVHEYHNGIIACLGNWKLGDEVHQNLFPWGTWGRKRL